MEKNFFGKTKDGIEISKYTLENSNGIKASFLNYGGILQSLLLSDKEGGFIDVVLGFDNIESYENNDCFLGAFVGPNANRIGKACYKIDGEEYHLEVNDGENNLHSHKTKGYHNRIFKAISFEEMETVLKDLNYNDEKANKDEEHILENKADHVIFYLKDEETNGFPGKKDVFVIYSLNDRNELIMEYKIISDKKTIINPTNHSYFNLDGHKSGNAMGQHLRLYSQKISKIDNNLIPTGEIMDVSGTALDFSGRKTVGKDLSFLDEELDFEGLDEAKKQIVLAKGYDHNFIINKSDDEVKQAEQMFYYNFTERIRKKEDFVLNKVAELASSNWKVRMMVLTDRPCVQFYSGNFLNGLKGKDGAVYGMRSGLCFESQGYPDAENHKEFESNIVEAGEVFDSTTVYRFL